MKLLLDTHALLFSLLDTARLSATAKAAIADTRNEIMVSSVSFWEIAIKFALGKLELQGVQPEELPAEAKRAGFLLVALDANVAATSHQFSRTIHRDPFDRVLAWQAIQSGWVLLSRDRAMSGYESSGLSLLW